MAFSSAVFGTIIKEMFMQENNTSSSLIATQLGRIAAALEVIAGCFLADEQRAQAEDLDRREAKPSGIRTLADRDG